MAPIKKNYANILAALSVICFITGLSQAITSWILYVKFSKMFIYYGTSLEIKQHAQEAKIMRTSYWWGGVFFIIPCVLGILSRMKRTIRMVSIFMIASMICLLLSIVATVFVTNLHLIASNVIIHIGKNECVSSYNPIHQMKECFCHGQEDSASGFKTGFLAMHVDCGSIYVMDHLLSATLTLGVVTSVMTLTMLFIAFFSLCNTHKSGYEDRVQLEEAMMMGDSLHVDQPVITLVLDEPSENDLNASDNNVHSTASIGNDENNHIETHDKANLIDNEQLFE